MPYERKIRRANSLRSMTDLLRNHGQLSPTRGISPRRLDLVWRETAQVLTQSGLPVPELDARLLLARACGLGHEAMIGDPSRAISDTEYATLSALVQRRKQREPVSRILGVREFWSHEFKIGPQILDPRADTESVVETVLELVHEMGKANKSLRIADIGTGSGCILLSLLSELPNAWGLGSDVSPDALGMGQANAANLGLCDRARFACGSWLDALAGPFDIVVSNPPYIPTSDIASLEPEVAQYDPRLALDGGHDGLDAYRAIIERLPVVLRRGGWAVFETGENQAPQVRALLDRAGYRSSCREYREKLDLAGKIRCVAALQL